MARSWIMKAVAGSLIGGIIISVITLWGVGLEEVFDHFRSADPAIIYGYVGVSILIALLLTLKWHVALAAYGVRMPFYTLFIYRLIGFAVAYVTPMSHVGGEPVRALLVGKQGIPMKVSFSAVIVDKSLELLFNIAIFFIGALIILNSASYPLAARATIFLLSLAALIAALVLGYHLVTRKKVLSPLLARLGFRRFSNWQRIKSAVDEVELLIEHFYSKRRAAFLLSLLINFALWALMFIEYRLALLILGYEVGLFGIFLFLTGVGIAYSIPIPAALGVLELGQVSAGRLLGIQSSIGLALAFLIRVRDIIWTVIGLILLAVLHFNFFSLYERSQRAAKKYNFRTLHLELRELYREED